ncbi:MAG: hypothetical protein C4533_00270 [Candidatus Omnitrophota bacterium]|jgi:branched-chain amino acid aminotransferase group I|nr:MAG: hypothetical protein C4533_00270 [Candidatus Omnitrophota bacterium]
MQGKMTVFFNGKFVDRHDLKASVLDEGFLYGYGLFETMRAYNNKILLLDQHIERMFVSAGLISFAMPYSSAKTRDIVESAVLKSGLKDAFVRLSCWRSKKINSILVIARKYKPYSSRVYKKGFSAIISRFTKDQDSMLSRIKSNNYLLCRLAFMEALSLKSDEAILLNNDGLICEGSRSNIFFVKNRRIYTPSLECGCLSGITRELIIKMILRSGLDVKEGKFGINQLYAADEAFFTNSLMGVMPLTKIGKLRINNSNTGKITEKLISDYDNLLKNA